MDWKTLPGFDEKYSKLTMKQHNTFGGKVIEVLYGAQDAEGNPVYPTEGTGYGRWFGIEKNGEYQMFSLTKPASQGGETEYGTEYKDEALEIMESQLNRKRDLCKEAESVVRRIGTNAEEELAALREEWNKLNDWGTPKDEEHAEHFERVVSEFETRIERVNAIKAAKQAVIDKAAELVDSTEWKKAFAEFRDLREELKELGSAGKDADDGFWGKFNEYNRAFNDKRKEFFANLDAMNEENKAKKEELIAKAKETAEEVKNWKNAGDKMNDLMEAWKAIKSAGRENDEKLWGEFNEIRRGFFAARRAFFQERDAQRKESIDKKSTLIEEAKKIAQEGDFSKNATDRMKDLDKEWREAGYSGKNDNDRLWDEFTAAKDMFWEGKRSENQKRFQEIIDRKQNTINAMKEQINDLQIRMYETDDYTRIRGYERSIEDKKDAIENLQNDIEDLKKKLD